MQFDRPHTALLLVDMQNDFLPAGALQVPDGDAVVPAANRLQRHFDLVVATQDWHPPDHISFAANHPGKKVGDVVEIDGQPQILWPVHCVQNSRGAALATGLDANRIDRIIQKGTDPLIDSYSGFFDNQHRRSTGLADYLRDHTTTAVYIAGLATDYCVKFTALDARRLGFEAVVVADACRGMAAAPRDVAATFDEMRAAGVESIESWRLFGS